MDYYIRRTLLCIAGKVLHLTGTLSGGLWFVLYSSPASYTHSNSYTSTFRVDYIHVMYFDKVHSYVNSDTSYVYQGSYYSVGFCELPSGVLLKTYIYDKLGSFDSLV